jgi:uncharacterized membrane protein YjjP (DUF1212 family)
MSEVAHEGERPADLTMALETLMRFGTLMLRAGDTAFRVRDWMSMIARGMGLDALSVNIALGGMTVTARRGGEHATLVSEIAPPGVNAWRLGALEHLARNTQPGMTPQELAAKLAKIEAEPPLYPLAAGVGLCSRRGDCLLDRYAAASG